MSRAVRLLRSYVGDLRENGKFATLARNEGFRAVWMSALTVDAVPNRNFSVGSLYLPTRSHYRADSSLHDAWPPAPAGP